MLVARVRDALTRFSPGLPAASELPLVFASLRAAADHLSVSCGESCQNCSGGSCSCSKCTCKNCPKAQSKSCEYVLPSNSTESFLTPILFQAAGIHARSAATARIARARTVHARTVPTRRNPRPASKYLSSCPAVSEYSCHQLCQLRRLVPEMR